MVPCLFCPDAINYSKGTWSVVNCLPSPPSNVLYSYETSSVRVKGCRSWAFVRRLWPLSLCFFWLHLLRHWASVAFFYVIRGSAQFVFSYDKQGVLWTYQYQAPYRMYPEDHVNRNVLTVRFYKDGQCYHLILSCWLINKSFLWNNSFEFHHELHVLK